MKIRFALGASAFVAVLLFGSQDALAACGDAVLNMNEECDPGGALHIDGNPSLATCTTGTNCFYALSCCKFNCQFVGQGAPCFDGNACTTNDICNNVGQCAAGGSASAGTACEDGSFCTTGDVCNAGGTCLSGGGNPCTGIECVSGCNEVSNNCNFDVGAPCTSDGNLCTTDVCNPGGACIHPNNTAPCQDNLFCNGADTCGGGSCSTHAGDPCASGGQCANACNEAADNCLVANATPCNDGLFCTDVDACASGACVGTGDPCAGGGECVVGCDEGSNNCDVDVGAPCTADSNLCTDDVCDSGGTCSHPDNTAPCQDSLFCNGADTCGGGSCSTHAGDPCAGGGQCADTCNEAVDNCNVADATPCDDGMFCTDVDACASGACVGSGDPCAGGAECSAACNEGADDCFDANASLCTDDGNPCTDDYCDGGGGCIHVANTLPCDDGIGCTTNDVCDGGVCVGDPPPECDDDNPCTVDSCSEPSGDCLYLDQPDPSCNDGAIAALVISNRDDVMGRDKLKWRWKKSISGTPILLEDVGDPLATTTYDLCVYDTSCPEPCPDPETMFVRTLRARVTVPPSPLWHDLSVKGRFIYKDRDAATGVSLIKVKMGTAPGIGVKASRTNLVLSAVNETEFFEQTPNVIVQLVNNAGACWNSSFDTFVRNTPRSFRTKVTKVVVN